MTTSTDHACHTAAPRIHRAVAAEPNDPRTIRIALEARETQWEAAPGITISGYGYHGQVPGPKPAVRADADSLARPADSGRDDGTQATHRPVAPGETFTYRFTPPCSATPSSARATTIPAR